MSVVCCLRLCMNSSKFLLEMNESKGSGNENKSCMTFAELNICATAVCNMYTKKYKYVAH